MSLHLSPTFSRTELREGAGTLGVPLSDLQLDKLLGFCTRLEETNRTMNLTRIAPEQYVALHLLDSLSIIQAISPAQFPAMLDAGTGAGFPGIPLAVTFPTLQVTLVDSTRKKLKFLEEVCAELKISNVAFVHSRIEDLARDRRYRDSCPLVAARALAPLEPLAELLLPLVAEGGFAVAYKGPGVEEELKSAEKIIAAIGCNVAQCKAVTIPGTDAARFLVVMEKRAETPPQYPRGMRR